MLDKIIITKDTFKEEPQEVFKRGNKVTVAGIVFRVEEVSKTELRLKLLPDEPFNLEDYF
ncbi:MAG: hypothetical protein GY861_26445 [bacterium]|nr:hypothetical protein [bacterium]